VCKASLGVAQLRFLNLHLLSYNYYMKIKIKNKTNIKESILSAFEIMKDRFNLIFYKERDLLFI